GMRWYGDGTFQPPIKVTSGSGDSRPNSVAIGDFNADGQLDFAVANIDSGNVSVLLQPHAPNTPVGTDVQVTLPSATLNFAAVSGAGQTTITTIDPGTAGSIPGGLAVPAGVDYEIQTSAPFTGPILVGLVVPGPISEADFNALVVCFTTRVARSSM